VRSPFVRLVHADWSTAPSKRWAVEAKWSSDGWLVGAPHPVGPVEQFVHDLLTGPQPSLAGFDFPIGLPAVFGRKTRFVGFAEAIAAFGFGEWGKFYAVSERAEEISLYRPFYPRVASSLVRQVHLLSALGATDMNDLKRQCERSTRDRAAACALFWTLGPNQVGKAAISGWQEIVQPARRAGALLWPFDGALPLLASASRLVVCETYPAEAYGHVGVSLRGGSKRSQIDRREATASLAARCFAHGIRLTDAMLETLNDGFGDRNSGDDAFDAAMGLFGMIEVVEGRRAAAPEKTEAPEWEGWILGQAG